MNSKTITTQEDRSMLEKERSLLIVTDIQGNLALLMHEREMLYRNTGILIDGMRVLDVPIIWVEQYPKGLGPTVPEVASHLSGITPLPKRTFSALRDPDIDRYFNEYGRDQVIICGIEAHVCVHQTTMDLLERGIETHVAADAVSSRTLFNKTIGLEKVAAAGAVITSVETVLFELLEVAEGEAFKKIQQLVK